MDYIFNLQYCVICMLQDKLIFYKRIFKNVKYMELSIIPKGLRRLVSSHYHVGSSGGRMGECKSLRHDVKNWVMLCGQCIAYNIWRNRKSELYFSWPVTSTFYIIHVDL